MEITKSGQGSAVEIVALQNKVEGKVNVKGNGQECPVHKSRFDFCRLAGLGMIVKSLVGPAWLQRSRDPSTAHDAHFVGVMLRSG